MTMNYENQGISQKYLTTEIWSYTVFISENSSSLGHAAMLLIVVKISILKEMQMQ